MYITQRRACLIFIGYFEKNAKEVYIDSQKYTKIIYIYKERERKRESCNVYAFKTSILALRRYFMTDGLSIKYIFAFIHYSTTVKQWLF